MNKGSPFKRAKIMQAALAAYNAMPATTAEEMNAKQDAFQAIGTYKSRGHGRGSPSRRYGNSCNNGGTGRPHQGPRECARRVRQAEARAA